MSSLSTLQNRIKRDPPAFRDDFGRILRNFEAQADLLLDASQTPASRRESAKEFSKLASFLSHVSSLYPDHGGDRVPPLLISLLDEHAQTLDPDLRLKLFQALVLLRNRGALDPEALVSLCFRLFRIRDKPLRQALYGHVVKDIRNVNAQKTNVVLNKKLENAVFRMLQDDERSAGSPAAAKRALNVVIEMYKRRVWTDARAVNVVAEACFSRITRNSVVACRFFLGIDDEIDELLEKELEDEPVDEGSGPTMTVKERIADLRSSVMAPKVRKRTKSGDRRKDKKLKALKQLTEGISRSAQVIEGTKDAASRRRKAAPRFPAIDLIHDPQTFAERLLRQARESTDRFEVRLVQLNLVSRVVGHHKLILLPFYTFCVRYLQPHQTLVTQVLACLIQASHELVPPDELEPLVRHLADQFVNDRTGPEIMAVGLNAVRELIVRVPLITNGQGMDDLLADLIAYRKYRRDRSVIVAARALINTLREINPAALHRRERGRLHDLTAVPLEYGQRKVLTGVEGAELLGEKDADRVRLLTEGDFTRIKRLKKLAEEKAKEPAARKSEAGRLRGKVAGYALVAEDGEEEEEDESEEEEDDEDDNIDEDSEHLPHIIDSNHHNGLDDIEIGNGDDDDDEEEEEPERDPAVVDPVSLEGLRTRKRKALEERLVHVKAERQAILDAKSARIVNNTEKAKRTKDFLMVQKSKAVHRKQTLSLKQQQSSLKKHIKQLEVKSKLLTKVRKRG